jgi:hypothetical protein
MKAFSISISLVTIALGACVDSNSGNDSDVDTTYKLSANGLTPSQFSNAYYNSAQLTQTLIDSMSATADDRASMAYVVKCALASGHNITGNYIDDLGQPQTITYLGNIGLADGWTSAALTSTQQQEVTACLTGHVNSAGANITISLRGAPSQLTCTSPELTGYTLQEGAYFGNVFDSTGLYVCKGTGTSTLSGRNCTYANTIGARTACGFIYTGLCSNVCVFSSGYATGCVYNSTAYNNPVTTYLTN